MYSCISAYHCISLYHMYNYIICKKTSDFPGMQLPSPYPKHDWVVEKGFNQ